MKKIICLVFILLVAEVERSRGDLTIGSCDQSWFLLEKAYCDTIFVKSMNNSNSPFDDCPGLYDEAHECFKKKVYDECFNREDHSEKHNKTVEFLEAEFGDEDFFCKYGLLPSMETVMKDVNLTMCIDQKCTDYKKCENPFRNAFNEQFKSSPADLEVMSKAFTGAKICQSEIASSCHIPENRVTYHFFDPTEFNPYDPVSMEKVAKATDTIEQGGSIKSDSATTVTVVIVVLVLLLVVGGVFFYWWRRDKNRAEIRRKKREGKSDNGQQQQNNGDTEMQPLTENAAVVQASDEVSSA